MDAGHRLGDRTENSCKGNFGQKGSSSGQSESRSTTGKGGTSSSEESGQSAGEEGKNAVG